MATRKNSEDSTKKSAALGVKTAAKKSASGTKTKATAKKAAKKTSAKKATSRKVATKRTLLSASEDKSFWVTNGEVLNNLLELAECLKRMESRVYKYHTADGRNDFALWVADVLLDGECATDLKKAKTASGASKVAVRHLKKYNI